jgi:hypothetical protein
MDTYQPNNPPIGQPNAIYSAYTYRRVHVARYTQYGDWILSEKSS